jgi:CHASE2 domain-containing sensor protein
MNRRHVSIVTEAEGATSSIDKDVSFSNTADIIRYLPRAAEIGFFAPFPNTLLERGTRERSVKSLFTGLETLAMYAIEIFACLTLWRRRRQFSVWLVCMIAAMGNVGLGLVTVNIGTLYRYRYPFLMLLIIVASESLMTLKLPKILKQQGLEEAAPRLSPNA